MRRRRRVDQSSGEDGIRLIWLVPAVILSAIVFLAANYGVNAILSIVDKAPVREHLKDAFATGALGLIESRPDDAWMGVHQTNDCLIFDFAARDASDPVLYLFAGARTDIDREPAAANCESLRDWLYQDPLAKFGEEWYLRYIHGYRAVAVVLLEFLSVENARALMKAASYGIFVLAIFANLYFLYGERRRDLGLFLHSQVGYLVISVALIGFFGLPYFGQSISHAPAIVTLGAFILAWSILDGRGRLNERTAVLLAIPFGLFTAYFEFLTGYLPVGVCVIAALIAVGWSKPSVTRIWPIIRVLVLCEATFVVSVGAPFALHVVATAVFHADGAQIASLFIQRLAFRMSQTTAGNFEESAAATLTISDVLVALLRQLTHLGFLGERGAVAILGIALGVCFFGAFDVLCSRCSRVTKFRMLLAAGTFVPVAMWVFLFQNHTTIHASFMVRILVVVPLAGGLAGWMWARALAEDRALGGAPSFVPWKRKRVAATGRPGA